MKRAISSLFLFFFIFSVAYAQKPVGKPKDVVLVLDISLSMIGKDKGAKNIFGTVREQAIDTVKRLKTGDTITIITFGTKVKQWDRNFLIRDENDRQRAIRYLKRVRANSQWTNTALMLNSLSKTLEDMSHESPDRLQVAFIFSDARDSPSPGAKPLEFQETGAERCKPNGNKKQSVYYFSITPYPNKTVFNQVFTCFPEAVLSSVEPEQLQELRDRALSNTIPKIEVSSSQSEIPKAGSSFRGELIIEANELAVGKTITPKLLNTDEQIENLQFPESEIQLTKGENRIEFSFDILPEATEKVYFSINPLTKEERNNVFFYPDNKEKFDIQVEISPLTFFERLVRLPEYYIPAILLLLPLLFLLYKLYKYITFVPVLRLKYWETPEEGDLTESKKVKIRAKAAKDAKKNKTEMPSDEELFSGYSEPLKQEIDFMEIEGDYFIASEGDPKKDFEPDLILPELKKREIMQLKKTGEGRKSKLRALGKWKAQIKEKENFGGSFFRNGCYFTYSQYSFQIETNLK